MSSSPVLILGAGGFIGRSLAESLATRGHSVIAATRRSTKFSDRRIENVVAEFRQAEQFRPLLDRSEIVVHAASSSTPGSSEGQPQREGRLDTVLALIEALQEYPDHRLIYLSSGGTLYGERDVPASEQDTLKPRSYHGAGKIAAEAFIHAWAEQYNGTAIVLRPSNVYGPGQQSRPDFGIIPAAFSCARKRRPMTIWGDGNTSRDYLFIDDLVRLCELSLSHPLERRCHTFNAAQGQNVTLDELLSLVGEITGHPLARVCQPPRRVDIKIVALDVSAARRVLGWQPRIGLKEGLERTWQWLLTQP